MEPRLSVVTLGVEDLDRAVAFYEALGLARYDKIKDGVAFFQMGGMILALWPREDLAKDAGLPLASGSAAAALGYNTRSEPDVDALLARAEAAGARILKPAQLAFWGGRQGYFADLDGHIWEVAHNPGFPIDSDGGISLP